MADGETRRVIEVQSDLYQKGRLEQEFAGKMGIKSDLFPRLEVGQEVEYLKPLE